MADLFSVTAPLYVKRDDGREHVMAERFQHPEGVLFFDLFWHQHMPASQAIHLLKGEIRGEGPWRIGDAVINVLGCQNTNPEMAGAFSEWQRFLENGAPGYPERAAIEKLAKAQGAIVSS